MPDVTRDGTPQRRKYPYLSLQQAIERARELEKVERRNSVPVPVALKHWGYNNPTSGIATTTLSAVKQFGLLDETGSGKGRQVSISKRAFTILNAPPDLKREAIRDAALDPPMHRLIWNKYGADTGSSEGFRWYLINDLGFSERGADEFRKQYAATLKFAGLDEEEGGLRTSETLSDTEEQDVDHPGIPPLEVVMEDAAEHATFNHPPLVDTWFDQSGKRVHVARPEPPPSSATTRHAIPLVGGRQVILEGEFPISEEAWNGFLVVLQAFKPGLVSSED